VYGTASKSGDGFFTSGRFWSFPVMPGQVRVAPASSTFFDTTGLNAAKSLSGQVRWKNLVAAVSPPVRIARRSSTLIARMASPKSFAASGTAASAARCMLGANSSSCMWWPARRARSATFWMLEGICCFTAALPKQPSVLDQLLSAFSVPSASASLMPAMSVRVLPLPPALPVPVLAPGTFFIWLSRPSHCARATPPACTAATRVNARPFIGTPCGRAPARGRPRNVRRNPKLDDGPACTWLRVRSTIDGRTACSALARPGRHLAP